MNTISTRKITVDMLLAVYVDSKKSHLVLKETLDLFCELEKRDRAFITRLFKGTIEKQIFLDFVINKFSKIKIDKIKPAVLVVLRMSVYQLFFMKNIPESAVVNEAVKIIKNRKMLGLVPFVNGVLRSIARNIEMIDIPNDLTIKYSIKEWIIDLFEKQFGKDITIKILEYFEKEKNIAIRISCKINIEEYKKLLNDYNIDFEESTSIKNSLYIKGIEKVSSLPGYNEGYFSVMDESSMLAGEIANNLNVQNILDMCAAPGGKSIHVADIKPDSKVLSFDVSENKIKLLKENINRMHLENVICEVNDGTIYRDDLKEAFDLVVMDVPCSGLGVIGDKPDIKNNITEKAIYDLNDIGKKILENGLKYCKSGGYLIYSTCTLTNTENFNTIYEFNKKYNVTPVDISNLIPKKTCNSWLDVKDEYFKVSNITEKVGELDNNFIQIIPGVFNMNGFFVALFKKA